MEEIIDILNKNYSMHFDRIELMRDGGSMSYTAFVGRTKYFLRILKPALLDTSLSGANINVFLQTQDFPVPHIQFTKDNSPYVKKEDLLLMLYEFIEGSDSDPEQDAEAIGALVGRLHLIMKQYPGELVSRNKHFYIGRYIEVLLKVQYPRVDEYIAYGDALWEGIKNLPRGYCHGDMYNGNIRRTPDGKLYIHDFDTSCDGFPMYDLALICDMTKYFDFDERNYNRSNRVLSRFMLGYRKYNTLSQAEIDAFHTLIAVQHFSTQATIMEMYGLDCIDRMDMDNQLDWLYRWRAQCR